MAPRYASPSAERTGAQGVGDRDAVGGQGAEHRADMVGADLVAEAPRAAVNHHADPAAGEPEDASGVGTGERVDGFDLQEVVARPKAAELAKTPVQGAVGHHDGVCVGEPAEVLAADEVGLDAEPGRHRGLCAVDEHRAQGVLAAHGPDTAGAESAGAAAVQGIHQQVEAVAETIEVDVEVQQPHPQEISNPTPPGKSTPPASNSVAATPPMGKPYPQ